MTEAHVTSLEAWKVLVRGNWPESSMTRESGAGETYGEEGDLTAHIGPDMQADVVGVWNTEDSYGWVEVKYAKEAKGHEPQG